MKYILGIQHALSKSVDCIVLSDFICYSGRKKDVKVRTDFLGKSVRLVQDQKKV